MNCNLYIWLCLWTLVVFNNEHLHSWNILNWNELNEMPRKLCVVKLAVWRKELLKGIFVVVQEANQHTWTGKGQLGYKAIPTSGCSVPTEGAKCPIRWQFSRWQASVAALRLVWGKIEEVLLSWALLPKGALLPAVQHYHFLICPLVVFVSSLWWAVLTHYINSKFLGKAESFSSV